MTFIYVMFYYVIILRNNYLIIVYYYHYLVFYYCYWVIFVLLLFGFNFFALLVSWFILLKWSLNLCFMKSLCGFNDLKCYLCDNFMGERYFYFIKLCFESPKPTLITPLWKVTKIKVKRVAKRLSFGLLGFESVFLFGRRKKWFLSIRLFYFSMHVGFGFRFFFRRDFSMLANRKEQWEICGNLRVLKVENFGA